VLVRHQLLGNKLSNVAPVAITMGSLFALTPTKSVIVDRQFADQDDQTPVHKAVRAALFKVPSAGATALPNDVIFYLGGYIGSQVSDKRDCDSCSRALIDFTKKPSNVSRYVAYREHACGKIHVYPSRTLFDVLRKTETVLRSITDNFQKLRDLPRAEIMFNMRMFFSDDNFCPECRDCVISLYHTHHKLELITQVVELYMNLRLSHALARRNESQTFEKNHISRHTLSKTAIFRGL
jgi:hypothetical protein